MRITPRVCTSVLSLCIVIIIYNNRDYSAEIIGGCTTGKRCVDFGGAMTCCLLSLVIIIIIVFVHYFIYLFICYKLF